MTHKLAGRIYPTLLSDFKLEFEWEIVNFCDMMADFDVGDYLISPKFIIKHMKNNIEWLLHLYPKGISERYQNYLSICLHCTPEIRAVATFRIDKADGTAVANFTTSVKEFGVFWSHGLILRSFVENPKNDILLDNNLTIICKVEYKNVEIEFSNGFNNKAKQQIVKNDISPNLEDMYEALLNDSRFSDASLITEGKIVKVHRCILARSNSVFASIFEQNNTVEINDIRYDILIEMLRFVYAGRVNNIDALVGELAIAADKYALNSLKITCEKNMMKTLNLDSVVEYLQLADRIRMDHLKEKAIEFIVENACDVVDKPEFKLLPNDVVYKAFYCLAKKNQI